MSFRTIKSLTPSGSLLRVMKMQTAAGFDLFTGGASAEEEIPALFLSRSAENEPELLAAAPSCFVHKTEAVSGGEFFSDAKTFSEFMEETLRKKSFFEINSQKVSFFSNLYAVFMLITRLNRAGITFSQFEPEYVVFQQPENAWKFLPVYARFTQFISPEGSESALNAFFTWLQRQIPASFESLQTLLHLASSPDFIARFGWKPFRNESLWNPFTPSVPFPSLRMLRRGSQVILRWNNAEKISEMPEISENSEKNEMSVKPAHEIPGVNSKMSVSSGGFPHSEPFLFELPAAASGKMPLPAGGTLFPSELLPALFESELPHAENDTSESRTVFIEGNACRRLCGVNVLGGWARIGRTFQVGGPEDTTFYEFYRDDDGSLVLDFQWPEGINRVQIAASPDRFVSGPVKGAIPPRVKVWWHDKLNPLIPKRISNDEISGWNTVYIRLFSYTDENGTILFSLGKSARSRAEISMKENGG